MNGFDTEIKTTKTSPRCFHPLIPSFAARLLFALRALIGIGFCAVITLCPSTSNLISGQLLLAVSFIVAIKVTVGATIQTAFRLILGGGIATCYCLLVVIYLPRNVYVAISATTGLVLMIVYTDLPVVVRRFTIVPTCIILLQWFSKTNINQYFVLQIWLCLTLGSCLSVFVMLIPLPSIPTAYSEFRIRLDTIRKQIRRELTTIILLIFEYQAKQIRNDNHRRHTNGDDDTGNDCNLREFDDLHLSSEDYNDSYLLRSDLEDLNSLVYQEIQSIHRSFIETSYEPYFIILNNWNRIRTLIRLYPPARKLISPPSTTNLRMAKLVHTFQSLQRTIKGLTILDKHNRSLMGQRKFVNSICILLELTFNYLDLLVDREIHGIHHLHEDKLLQSRFNIEESLETFFEEYVRFRENSLQQIQANHEDTHLNTFLLLLLRCVHVIMEIEEIEHTSDNEKCSIKLSMKTFLINQLNYIGLRPSFGKVVRALKTGLSVLLSTIIVISLRDRLQAYRWIHWAPMTTALVSDSSEGGTIRLSLHRLTAVLVGSTYAYLIVLLTQNRLVVGILISLFVCLMGYLKTDPKREYFSIICGQSASIITFLSTQDGKMNVSTKAVLARTSLTFLGVFVHVLVSNLILPVTARALVKKKISVMIKNVIDSLTCTIGEFRCFIDPSHSNDEKSPSINIQKILSETERLADTLPVLVDEALNEPNLWKRPFVQVKDHYHNLAKSLRQMSTDIRFIHRCTIILQAESKLHFALEAKWQVRRFSILPQINSDSHNWTVKQPDNEKKIFKDLDVPLKLLISHPTRTQLTTSATTVNTNNSVIEGRLLDQLDSSRYFRSANLNYYRPVLECLTNLEKQILEVLGVINGLLYQKAIVDIGFDGFHQFYRNDSLQLLHVPLLKRDPSIFIPEGAEKMPISSANPYRCCSWCHQTPKENQDSLPSLRSLVDRLIQASDEFLIANYRFIRSEFVWNQSIGDVLAFHTLSYAMKNVVQSTVILATNVRRIKHLNINPRSTTSR